MTAGGLVAFFFLADFIPASSASYRRPHVVLQEVKNRLESVAKCLFIFKKKSKFGASPLLAYYIDLKSLKYSFPVSLIRLKKNHLRHKLPRNQ